MKKYELTYLVPPEPKESNDQERQAEIESFIAEKKGEVVSVKADPARRDLGVEIGKKKSARMISLLFVLDPVHISGLEKLLKKSEGIMRHILIKKPNIRDDREGYESRSNLERRPSDKVELRDIDRKIEEIISE